MGLCIPAIRSLIGESLQILEPSEAIARQTERVLERADLVHPGDTPAVARFCTTGNPAHLHRALRQLLHLENAQVSHLQWREGILEE